MKRVTTLFLAGLFAHSSACQRAPAPAAAPPHEEASGNGTTEVKTSDLDLPAEVLLARTCEHGMKAFECDECRYQVGVVRVPKALLDDGLVATAVVGRRKLEATLPLTGELRFDERRVTHVAPNSEARVRSVRVSLGQRVAKGEALVELESVALGEAQSHFKEARGALELTRRSAERIERLRAEKIASEKEWLQARQERDGAEIRARAAREKLLQLGLTAGEVEEHAAQEQRSRHGVLVLRAPAAGVVLEMHAVPGELVRPEQAILTVGDLSALWLWADLYEDQLARVAAAARGALRAGVTVRAYPGEVFPGTVDLVGPTMDEKTRTVKVRLAMQNPEGKLRAGMFAAVQLYLPGDALALAVPRGAVLSDEGRAFVFIHHHGDYFLRRPVSTGRSSPDWVEVTAGLSGGEAVVVNGAFLLKSDVLRSKMGAGCAD
jgi:cobalt-zinc-cadmium efflux system membrane fusion protein